MQIYGNMVLHGVKVAGLAVLGLVGASAASATVTIYTSASAFAAAVNIQHQAGFSGVPVGRSYTPFTDDGITFTALGLDFYGVPGGGTLTGNPNTFPTASLSADGDENFEFKLAAGGWFNAVGLDYATNAYGPPALSLYTIGGVLIDTVAVTIPPNKIGFFGIVSSTPLVSVRSVVDRGYLADTAIDNVRIGTAAAALFEVAAVPEPATWALMLVGFGVMGAAARRRQRTTLRFA